MPKHGSADFDTYKRDGGYPVGAEVTYGCDYAFILKGEETQGCRENGQWSNTFPKCGNYFLKERMILVGLFLRLLYDRMTLVE